MKQTDQEALFRRMASEYVEMEGQKLLAERHELEQVASLPTPGLDKKVLGVIRRRRRMGYVRGFALAAACFALILLIPRLLGPMVSSPPDSAAAEDGYPAVESSATADPADGDEPEPQLIPLSFTLPDNFTVAAAELDNGKSVYHLENTQLDDVILTMEYTSDTTGYDRLEMIEVDGRTVHGRSTADYNLISFNRGDLVYVLTCRHDINTLVPLVGAIL